MKTKTKKKTFLNDTFEQLSDTAKSTVKKAGISVNQTFNPLDSTRLNDQLQQEVATEKIKESLEEKKQNHTPIDFKNFENSYKQQDEKKAEELRNRLFKLVKEGEEQAYQEKKKKEEEINAEEERKKEEEKKKNEERKKQQDAGIPKGKQRRNIFSPKKKAEQQHAEYRPSGGQG